MSEPQATQAVAGKPQAKRQMYEPCRACVDGAILDGGGSVHQCCCQSMRVMPVGAPVETLECLVKLDTLRKESGITAAMLRDGRAAAIVIAWDDPLALEARIGELNRTKHTGETS